MALYPVAVLSVYDKIMYSKSALRGLHKGPKASKSSTASSISPSILLAPDRAAPKSYSTLP